MTSKASLGRVKEKWIPEVQSYCPNTPIILVGTKADLRTDQEELARLEKSGEEVVNEEEVTDEVQESYKPHSILGEGNHGVTEEQRSQTDQVLGVLSEETGDFEESLQRSYQNCINW